MSLKKWNIKDLQEFAKTKQGLCLSAEYINSSTVYEWRCSNGHVWKTNWNNVKNHNRWCKFCAWNNLKKPKKWNIKDLQVFANQRNGECLDIEYISSGFKYQWKCNKEHIWFATWENIQNGHWCPLCNKGSKGEELVDRILNKDFNFELNKDYYREYTFENCKYERKLYFDFYIPKYNLIIEYDGQQHFIEKPHFWKNDLTLEERIMRDKIKDKFCEDNGINLIRIPYNMYSKIEAILTQEFNNGFIQTLNFSLKKRNKLCV